MLKRCALVLVLVGALSVGALPVSAAQTIEPGPVVDVANPGPGDTLPLGKTVIEGVAIDPAATTGTGIDRVEFFLDMNREQGGEPLGAATLGSVNPFVSPNTQFAQAGFTFTMPVVHQGNHQLFIYSHSAVSGMERVVEIPFIAGKTDAPELPDGVTLQMSTYLLP